MGVVALQENVTSNARFRQLADVVILMSGHLNRLPCRIAVPRGIQSQIGYFLLEFLA